MDVAISHLVLLLALTTNGEVINVALDKEAWSEPIEATCGQAGPEGAFYEGRYIDCIYGCPNFVTSSPVQRYKPYTAVPEPYQFTLGMPNCTSPISNSFGGTGVSFKTQEISPSIIDQDFMVKEGCYFDGGYEGGFLYETYSMWLHPDSKMRKGLLMQKGTFGVQLEQVYTTPSKFLLLLSHRQSYQNKWLGFHRTISNNWYIPTGQWTKLVLTLKRSSDNVSAFGFENAPIEISVYINGQYMGPTMLLGDQPSALQRRKRKRQTELPSMYSKLNIGRIDPTSLGYGNTLNNYCEETKVSYCREVGYSSYVVQPNQQKPAGKAQTVVTGLIEELLSRCLKQENYVNPDLVKLFGCAHYLPACDANVNQVRLCQNMCKVIMDACGSQLSGFPFLEAFTFSNGTLDCSRYPSQEKEQCIGQDYIPSIANYMGKVRNFRLYNDVRLTQRDVEYEDSWDKLNETTIDRPQCICDKNFPMLDNGADYCLTTAAKDKSMGSASLVSADDKWLRIGSALGGFTLPGFAVDSYTETAWIASPKWIGNEYVQDIRFTVDFGFKTQIFNLYFMIGNSMPLAIYLELGDEFFGDPFWKLIHVLVLETEIGQSCKSLGYEEKTENPTSQVICEMHQGFVNLDLPHMVMMDLLDGRQGWKFKGEDTTEPSEMTKELETFLTGQRIRLRFSGLNYLDNVFSVNQLEVNGRKPPRECNCYPYGTVIGGLCDPETGQCPCIEEAQGNLSKDNVNCEPFIDDVFPAFGPEAGGTDVLLWGGFLGADNASMIVRLEDSDINFEIIYSNETYIHCISPAVNFTTNPTLLQRPLSFKITLKNGNSFTTSGNSFTIKQTFTYKENPVIEAILPLQTFLRGGIEQTVIGQHLDSVAVPVMFVTLVNFGTVISNPGSPCTLSNSTHMVCPTPVINLPTGLAEPGGSRKKREVQNGMTEADQRVHSISRTVRQTNNIVAGEINRDYRQFYLGFKMDGVKTYENVSKVLPEYGVIHVFTNPELEDFDPFVRVFKPYKGEEYLRIEGERLDYGCELKDYLVEVGENVCVVQELFTNFVICIPPEEKPDDMFHIDGHPRVIVNVGNIRRIVGHLQYHFSPWDDPSVRSGVIAFVIILIIMILIAIAIVVWYKKFRHKYPVLEHLARLTGRKKRTDTRYQDHQALERRSLLDRLNPELREKILKCLVDPSRMTIESSIGSGNFGKVHSGTLADKDHPNKVDIVAIKTIRDEDSNIREITEFLEEGTIMMDFDHKNVLGLLGVSIVNDKPHVIIPMMDKGDLKKYVTSPHNTFTLRQLVEFTHQIAKGMAYLSGKKFVHRDLAARNCMVDSDHLVKVADFGLARDIYEKEYYRIEDKTRPLPVRWMALETMEAHTFTTQSDVWSFGVVMWEVLTRGKKPYADITNADIKRHLNRGARLEKPEFCTEEVYKLMCQCWNPHPDDRPTFSELESKLNMILNESKINKEEDCLYDDNMINPDHVGIEIDNDNGGQSYDANDYLVIVPHPVDQYLSTAPRVTDNSESGESETPLLQDSPKSLSKGRHPLDAGYDRISKDMRMKEQAYMDKLNSVIAEDKNGENEEQKAPSSPVYLAPSTNNNDKQDPNFNVDTPYIHILPSESNEDYYQNIETQSNKSNLEKTIPPKPSIEGYLEPSPTLPRNTTMDSKVPSKPVIEGYLEMENKPKLSPKPSPKPKQKSVPLDSNVPCKPVLEGYLEMDNKPKLTPKPSPKPKPKNLELDANIPSKPILEGYLEMEDKSKLKHSPSPKPKRITSLDTNIPSKPAVEGYLEIESKPKVAPKPSPRPKPKLTGMSDNGHAEMSKTVPKQDSYETMTKSDSIDSQGYEVPVSSNDDDTIQQVSNRNQGDQNDYDNSFA